MNNINDLPVLDAEIVNNEVGAIQTKTSYTTAMQIIKPRNLAVVQERVLQEASIAGDEFYYSWSQGGSIIEGLTVGGAIAISRNMGNCAVPTTVEETKEAYFFTSTFIDLETGFNLQRSFRQNKVSPKNKNGKEIYSGERGADIIFQIGQSKSIRNVILNAVPNWLAKKVLEKAKENISQKLENMGAEKARAYIEKKANALKIDIATIEASFGQKWDTVKMVQISGALRAVEDGYSTIKDAFPPIKENKDDNQKNDINSLKVTKQEENKDITVDIVPISSQPPKELLRQELLNRGATDEEAGKWLYNKSDDVYLQYLNDPASIDTILEEMRGV
ncbi:hypothetical protein N5U36_00385 [Aliarcobacter butzleri]|uniref:hypothetical protein n=1 Tax=Aliarcobacter butzleri TaxID=28197 RepID=UPI0021B33B24|nr:hypothetical protein [Aliarcobacter butzleri]MCT7633889.1 hypothetical protein [Aliarcobacter butzleri]